MNTGFLENGGTTAEMMNEIFTENNNIPTNSGMNSINNHHQQQQQMQQQQQQQQQQQTNSTNHKNQFVQQQHQQHGGNGGGTNHPFGHNQFNQVCVYQQQSVWF